MSLGILHETRSFLDGLPPQVLAEVLLGGLSTTELAKEGYADHEEQKLIREAVGIIEYLLPPLPNALYTRDTTCWIYGGVTLNPLYWPARHEETVLTTTIYKFHPDFGSTKVNVWWGDPTVHHGSATLEGGDVMPIGNKTVLIGMSERTSNQAITQLAAALFANKHSGVERLMIASMPKLRSAMHLDTVFIFCDRDVVTLYPAIVNQISTFSLRPDDGPTGMKLSRDKGTFVEAIAGERTGPRAWRRPLYDLPNYS